MLTNSQKQLVQNHMYIVDQVIRKHFNKCTMNEDVKQAGYMGLCRAALKHDGVHSFKPYAFNAVRWSIIAMWRQQKKVNKEVLADDLSWLVGKTEDSVESVDSKFCLNKCLGKLDSQSRDIVIAWSYGESLKDLAQKANTQYQSVQMQFHQALDVLRQQIGVANDRQM